MSGLTSDSIWNENLGRHLGEVEAVNVVKVQTSEGEIHGFRTMYD